MQRRYIDKNIYNAKEIFRQKYIQFKRRFIDLQYPFYLIVITHSTYKSHNTNSATNQFICILKYESRSRHVSTIYGHKELFLVCAQAGRLFHRGRRGSRDGRYAHARGGCRRLGEQVPGGDGHSCGGELVWVHVAVLLVDLVHCWETVQKDHEKNVETRSTMLHNAALLERQHTLYIHLYSSQRIYF